MVIWLAMGVWLGREVTETGPKWPGRIRLA